MEPVASRSLRRISHVLRVLQPARASGTTAVAAAAAATPAQQHGTAEATRVLELVNAAAHEMQTRVLTIAAAQERETESLAYLESLEQQFHRFPADVQAFADRFLAQLFNAAVRCFVCVRDKPRPLADTCAVQCEADQFYRMRRLYTLMAEWMIDLSSLLGVRTRMVLKPQPRIFVPPT